ncbi:MAG: hypothetical protein PHC98_01315 [Syntrophotalea acetylenica]|jgi:hypothetical protein|nr:hypothetical protein [Syntrophotalea acetylenica]
MHFARHAKPPELGTKPLAGEIFVNNNGITQRKRLVRGQFQLFEGKADGDLPGHGFAVIPPQPEKGQGGILIFRAEVLLDRATAARHFDDDLLVLKISIQTKQKFRVILPGHSRRNQKTCQQGAANNPSHYLPLIPD